MLSMYDERKGTFVYRTLVERVVPSCVRYAGVFGPGPTGVAEEFVRREYPDEVPPEVLGRYYESLQQ